MPPRKSLRKDSPKNVFGKDIRRIRLAKKMTVKAVLAKLEIAGWSLAPSAWTLIEGAKRSLTDIELVAILKVLKAKFSDLEWK